VGSLALHVVEQNVGDGVAGGKRVAPMQKFMTPEGDAATRGRATVEGLSAHQDVQGPSGGRGEGSRNCNFACRTIAMSGYSITRSV
jgi:hypothetical protein